MARLPCQQSQFEVYNLFAFYHPKYGKQSGGIVQFDRGIYRVWSKLCPAEAPVKVFDVVTEGQLMYCLDKHSLTILISNRGEEYLIGDATPPSYLFLEFRGQHDAQRFKESILQEAAEVTHVRLHIQSVARKDFNDLIAPYYGMNHTTGEADSRRAKLEKISIANNALLEQMRHVRKKVDRFPAPQPTHEQGLQEQLTGSQISNPVDASRNRTLESSTIPIQSASHAQCHSNAPLNEKSYTVEASNRGHLKRIEILEAQLATAETSSTGKSEQIKSLEEQKSEMQAKVTQDSKRLQEMTDSLKTNEKCANARPPRNVMLELQTVNAANGTLGQMVEELERSRNVYRDSWRLFKGHNDDLKGHVRNLIHYTEQAGKHIEGLESEIKVLKTTTVISQAQEIETLKGEVRQLKDSIEERDQVVAAVTSESSSIRAALADMRAEEEKKIQERENSRSTVANIQTCNIRNDKNTQASALKKTQQLGTKLHGTKRKQEALPDHRASKSQRIPLQEMPNGRTAQHLSFARERHQASRRYAKPAQARNVVVGGLRHKPRRSPDIPSPKEQVTRDSGAPNEDGNVTGDEYVTADEYAGGDAADSGYVSGNEPEILPGAFTGMKTMRLRASSQD